MRYIYIFVLCVYVSTYIYIMNTYNVVCLQLGVSLALLHFIHCCFIFFIYYVLLGNTVFTVSLLLDNCVVSKLGPLVWITLGSIFSTDYIFLSIITLC